MRRGAYFWAKKQRMHIVENKNVAQVEFRDYLQRMNRSFLTVGTLDKDPRSEARYWLSKTPQERLIALELLRMRLANYDNTTARLQRFYTVAQLIPAQRI